MSSRPATSPPAAPNAPPGAAATSPHTAFEAHRAPSGPVVALVPLRTPGTGKTRLGGGGTGGRPGRAGQMLSPEERAALAAAMLADVAAALRCVPIDRVVVAASGPEAAT
ncbi:MAG: hypothetical protein M3252_02360, partial [Actinomycetota bacterium]|nr:hypothetical protein [Actinomycetota bacterium]